jgi:hypothetical protein
MTRSEILNAYDYGEIGFETMVEWLKSRKTQTCCICDKPVDLPLYFDLTNKPVLCSDFCAEKYQAWSE